MTIEKFKGIQDNDAPMEARSEVETMCLPCAVLEVDWLESDVFKVLYTTQPGNVGVETSSTNLARISIGAAIADDVVVRRHLATVLAWSHQFVHHVPLATHSRVKFATTPYAKANRGATHDSLWGVWSKL